MSKGWVAMRAGGVGRGGREGEWLGPASPELGAYCHVSYVGYGSCQTISLPCRHSSSPGNSRPGSRRSEEARTTASRAHPRTMILVSPGLGWASQPRAACSLVREGTGMLALKMDK